ncbi:MAG: phage tail tape measure protein [Desulfobacteraceae bacterium]|nr:phage tail tape measure protein [Desulfobacteraceae bacterium]
MKQYSIAFKIGASLKNSFNAAFSGASKQVESLGGQIKKLESGSVKIDRFVNLQTQINKTGTEIDSARKRLQKLKEQLAKAKKPTKALKTQTAAAGKAVAKLEQKLKDQRRALGACRKQLTDAGIDTRKLAGEKDRLAASIGKAKKSQEKLNKTLLKQKQIAKRRERYKSKLSTAAGLGASIAAPAFVGAQAEELKVRLSTVINAKDKDKALAEAQHQARRMAEAGISGYTDAFNIQYALNSASLSAKLASAGAATVGKTARITGGQAEGVGEVIATAYNNLGDQIEGTDQQKLNRIAELLTKTQFKFQIRDFDQLGESMKNGASMMGNYNVQVAQGITLLGQLNSAGFQAGEAGTALSAVLRSLGKAQDKWGASIVRNKKGELDMIATLQSISSALDDKYGDDIDARAQAVQDVFGDEGAKGLVPLIKKLEALKQAYRDVEQNSKGIIDAEFKKFAQTTKGKTRELVGSLTVLADCFSAVVLPPAKLFIGALAFGTKKITAFAEKFPVLFGVVAGGATGIGVLTAAVIAGAFAFTFLQGGLLNAFKVFTLLRNSTLLATAASWLFNASLWANPITWVVAGIAALVAGAVLLYKKWEPFRNLIDALWDKLKAFAKFMYKFSKVGMGLKLGKKIYNFFKKNNTPDTSSAIKSDDSDAGQQKELQSGKPATALGVQINRAQSPAVIEKQPDAAIELPVTDLSKHESSTNVTINYAPKIEISGSGAGKHEVKSAVNESLDQSEARLKPLLEKLLSEEKRLSYQ